MRALNTFVAQIGKIELDKNSGLAVRCISDTKANKISSISDDLQLNIYPNPVSKNVYISNHQKLILHIQIYTLKGELVFDKYTAESEPSIDVEHFSKGIYIIKVNNNQQEMQYKLVIE